jgi:two-component sensor histidine kinase
MNAEVIDAGPVPPLGYLTEPTLVLGGDGVILSANRPAIRFLGRDLVGRRIEAISTDPPADVARILRRASGTSAPQVGAIGLRAAGGARIRLHAARLPGSGPARIVLRFFPDREDVFALVSRRVRELDAQLRRRLEEKAILEAALEDKQRLLQELQHRVKNNIQMMMTLIKLSARGHPGPDVAAVVATAERRLQAMAASQEAIYVSDRPGSVAVRGMLEDVLSAFRQTSDVPVLADIGEARIPSDHAHCLALVFSDALAGLAAADGAGTIRVAFATGPRGIALSLWRDLRVAAPAEALVDLALLRPLARQMGGDVEATSGRRLRIRLIVPLPAGGPA